MAGAGAEARRRLIYRKKSAATATNEGQTMTDKEWTFSPYLRVDNAAAAIDWYVDIFGAKEKERHTMPDGKIVHAELDIHGNLLCLADTERPNQFVRPKSYNEVPITLYAIVPDTDALFKRAIEKGARADREPTDQSYGFRSAGFIDPFGHVWYVMTPVVSSVA